jgi:hypothetical protein
MWSHYSDSHKGFCVELERTDFNELGNWEHCVPVQYEENVLTFKPSDLLNQKTVTLILITKSINWSYEAEWRIIAKQGNQTYSLPGNITRIIFGCRTSMENQRTIAKILGDDIQYARAKQNDIQYSVDIMPVSFSKLMNST